MRVTWRRVIGFVVLVMAISVALKVSFCERQDKQARLSVWQQVGSQQAPWSVLQWCRALKRSSFPMPNIIDKHSELLLIWTSVSAHDLLPRFSLWLTQSAWAIQRLRVMSDGSLSIALRRPTPNRHLPLE